VQKGNVAVMQGVGEFTHEGKTWWVGNDNNQLRFVDETDLQAQQATTSETLFREYAPTTYNFRDVAEVNKEGVLVLPSNGKPIGELIEKTENNIIAFIHSQGLKLAS